MLLPGQSVLSLKHKKQPCVDSLNPCKVAFVSRVLRLRNGFDTDIKLKTLRRSLEVFNMKIIMRRGFVIFYYKITKSATPSGGGFQIKLKLFLRKWFERIGKKRLWVSRQPDGPKAFFTDA